MKLSIVLSKRKLLDRQHIDAGRQVVASPTRRLLWEDAIEIERETCSTSYRELRQEIASAGLISSTNQALQPTSQPGLKRGLREGVRCLQHSGNVRDRSIVCLVKPRLFSQRDSTENVRA